MAFAEDPSIQNEDWRLQVMTTLAAPFLSPQTGHTHAIGTPIKGAAIVQFDPATVLQFGLPNIAALLLSFAKGLWVQSRDLVGHFDATAPNGARVATADGPILDILERRMGVVVFSFTALEAFANEVIAEAYDRGTYRYTRRFKKQMQTMSLIDVERHTSLDDKLDIILPAILCVKSPRGGLRWQLYLNLKELRDRIIHCKKQDRGSTSPGDMTLWEKLADDNFRDFADDAKVIIDHYWASQGQHRWYRKWPF